MDSHYCVSTGNVIKPEDGPTLIRYCQDINALSEEDLRKLKREIRSEAMVRDIGAHIGLIQTSLLSGNKLDFIVAENPGSRQTFTLTAKIDKEPS